MKLDLMKTLKRIEKNINFKGKTDVEKLKVAYEETLRLRSQLLSILFDEGKFCHLKNFLWSDNLGEYDFKGKKSQLPLQ